MKSRLSNLIPIRYFMMFLVVTSLLGIMMSNMCITIAFQAMTVKHHVNKSTSNACPIPTQALQSEMIKHGKECCEQDIQITNQTQPTRLRDKLYNWSQTTQSVMFASVFFTNVVFKTAAGIVVAAYGGRWVMTICLYGGSLLSLFIPIFADHAWVIIALRLLMGFFYSGVIPASYDLIVKWIPLKERSICFSLMEVGTYLATIITFATSGIVYETWGWPALFYMPGSAGTAVATVVMIFLRSQPNDVSQKELQEISANVPKTELNNNILSVEKQETAKSLETPFKEICCNKAVLTATFFRFSTYFNTFLIASKVPAYLRDIQHQEISINGYINASTSVVTLFSIIFNGWLSGFMINRQTEKTKVRKIFASAAGFGISSCLFLIPFAGCNSLLLIVILLLLAFFDGCHSNLQALPSEMTKNFPAVTYSLMATVACSGGFVAPSYAGMILDRVTDQWTAWCIIFWSTACMMILMTFNFIMNASAERQDFDFIDEKAPKKAIPLNDQCHNSKC